MSGKAIRESLAAIGDVRRLGDPSEHQSPPSCGDPGNDELGPLTIPPVHQQSRRE